MDFSAFKKILAVNIKHNFLVHMGIALLIFIFTTMLFHINALDYRNAAQPIEMFLSLAGAVLLVPVFFPEQDESIRDVIRVRKTDYLGVCVIRVMYSVCFLALLIGGFVLLMKFCECEVTVSHFIGGFASALFLGTVGFAFAGISRNVTVGYMAAFIYYIGNIGLKDKLGVFYLFSMYAGEDQGKWPLLLASVLGMALVFAFLKGMEKFK